MSPDPPIPSTITIVRVRTTAPSPSATQILGLATLGVAALVAFVFQELRHPEPMVSMELFRNKVFTITSGIGFVVGFAMMGSIVYLSIYLQVSSPSRDTISKAMVASPVPTMGKIL